MIISKVVATTLENKHKALFLNDFNTVQLFWLFSNKAHHELITILPSNGVQLYRD